jgi:hypothetical protein
MAQPMAIDHSTPPNCTIYVNNLFEKINKEGESACTLGGEVDLAGSGR